LKCKCQEYQPALPVILWTVHYALFGPCSSRGGSATHDPSFGSRMSSAHGALLEVRLVPDSQDVFSIRLVVPHWTGRDRRPLSLLEEEQEQIRKRKPLPGVSNLNFDKAKAPKRKQLVTTNVPPTLWWQKYQVFRPG
jgi:hypothetical protein